MKRFLAVAAAISLPITALMAVPAAQAGDVTPIVIAVEAPLSGPQASNGRDIARGVKLAVDQVNEQGGINGRPVVLVRIDDQANPDLADDAVAQAQAAGAVAVVGPYNSSVGVINLPLYLAAGIVPIQMTSTDLTSGMGVTVQPKNSQISPTELEYVLSQGATRVAMLVDPSTYTQGMADRLRAGLKAAGVRVTTVPIVEGKASYGPQVRAAMRSNPDFIYVSTYFPEGAKIAEALNPLRVRKPLIACLMGMGNVDPGMILDAGISSAQRCAYSGVPEASQLPGSRARAYVTDYLAAFHVKPGVWGTFSFDSARLLFGAMRRTNSTDFSTVLDAALHVSNFAGATGHIAIDPATGNREVLPVSILYVHPDGTFSTQIPAPL